MIPLELINKNTGPKDGMIFKQITAIMAEADAIGKARKNVQQNYQFRGIDDVYNTLHDILAKHGVFCVPTVMDMDREERTTKSGSVLIYTVLTIMFTFYAQDGSSVQSIIIGEGMDSGDKSCNKAMSVAQKYAFLQVFCIPTEEPKDPENDSPEPMPRETKDGAHKKGKSSTKDVLDWYEQTKKDIAAIGSIEGINALWSKNAHEFAQLKSLDDAKYQDLITMAKQRKETLAEASKN